MSRRGFLDRRGFLEGVIAKGDRAEAARVAAGGVTPWAIFPDVTWLPVTYGEAEVDWPHREVFLSGPAALSEETVLHIAQRVRWIWLELRGTRAANLDDADFRVKERQARREARRWAALCRDIAAYHRAAARKALSVLR